MSDTASDFSSSIIDGVLCIEDLNLGRTSVTNDMENVLEKLFTELDWPRVDNHPPIIYRDSTGVWDRVYLSSAGGVQFRHYGTSTRSDAIEFVKIDEAARIAEENKGN